MSQQQQQDQQAPDKPASTPIVTSLDWDKEEPAGEYVSQGKIAAVVACYQVVSISLVLLNKTVLNSRSLPYPLFVTWTQLVVSVICIWIMSIGKTWMPTLMKELPTIHLEFEREKAKRVMPLTLIFVLMVAFNNLCLQYVQVSFYQVARSTTILFSILFTYLLLNTITSFRSCIVVMVGFALGSLGELQFSSLGMFYGVLSSVFIALYGIFVKRVSPVVDNDTWRLMAYNSELSVVALIPLIIISGEAVQLPQALDLIDLETVVYTLLSGLFGFLLNIVIFLQIKYTSPLTNNVSGYVKGGLQLIVSAMVFGDTVTPLNALGTMLVVAGSAWYSHIRYLEMNETNRNREPKKWL